MAFVLSSTHRLIVLLQSESFASGSLDDRTMNLMGMRIRLETSEEPASSKGKVSYSDSYCLR